MNSATSDLRIHVEMVALLIFTNIQDTPWANHDRVGVANKDYYQGNSTAFLPTCDMDKSIIQFSQSMFTLSQNDNFIDYDYAVAVMKYFNLTKNLIKDDFKLKYFKLRYMEF
jgi:hypothetical protein